MPVKKWKLGTLTTVFSTELNGLANNTNVVTTSVFNNTQGGGGGDGYTLCNVELVVQFVSAPTAGTGVSVWFLARPDGTNDEDGSASVTPARQQDVVIPVRPVSTAQRINRRAWLPWGNFDLLLRNDGTGQAFVPSGNTLKIGPATPEGV